MGNGTTSIANSVAVAIKVGVAIAILAVLVARISHREDTEPPQEEGQRPTTTTTTTTTTTRMQRPSYEPPPNRCELCLDTLPADLADRADAAFAADDPEHASIAASGGDPGVARCAACRDLTTRLHALRFAADARAARLELAAPCEARLALARRRLAAMRGFHPRFRPVPCESHLRSLNRLRLASIAAVEDRLRLEGRLDSVLAEIGRPALARRAPPPPPPPPPPAAPHEDGPVRFWGELRRENTDWDWEDDESEGRADRGVGRAGDGGGGLRAETAVGAGTAAAATAGAGSGSEHRRGPRAIVTFHVSRVRRAARVEHRAVEVDGEDTVAGREFQIP